MNVSDLFDSYVKVRFNKQELLVLERYVKVLKNSEVPDVSHLLRKLLQQQLDFVMDCLVTEAKIKFDDLETNYNLWQRFFKWVGRL